MDDSLLPFTSLRENLIQAYLDFSYFRTTEPKLLRLCARCHSQAYDTPFGEMIYFINKPAFVDILSIKSAGTQPKIPAQKNTLVIHYLPTLALSKSGSGLKRPLTLSPPVRAPHFFVFHITFVMVFFITALLYTLVPKMQVFST